MATNPPYIDVIALNFRPILVCRIATFILMPPHTVISNWFWYGYGSCDGIRIHTCVLSISALVANQYSVLLSSAHHHHHRHCHHSEVEAYPISIQFNLNNRFSNLSYLIRMFNVQSLCCVCVVAETAISTHRRVRDVKEDVEEDVKEDVEEEKRKRSDDADRCK